MSFMFIAIHYPAPGQKDELIKSMTKMAEFFRGKPGLIEADMVKPGAAVIDVGINVREDGSITGDVAFDAVAEVAGAITPVPGGVGQLTNLMLLKQTLLAQSHWSSDV